MLNMFYFSAKLTNFIMFNNKNNVVMKTFKYYFRKLIPLLLTGFLFVSCGTHNSNDYDESDGIYSTNKTSTVEEDTSALENEKNNYYKQYFKTKELTYSDIPEDNVIFTDIEAYHSSESLDEDGYIVIEEENYNDEGYGAWGTNGTETTINIYGGYGYSPYWGGGYWGMSFGWGWGYPYYGYGWGYPYYGYGWGYPYYGYGYSYPYYGYGYGYPYCGSGYYNGYAYNRGRRNTDYYANRSSSRSNTRYSRDRTTSSRRNSSYTSRRGSYSRGETSRRSSYTNSNNTVRRSGSSTQRRNSVNRSSTSRRSTNYSRPSSSRSNSYRSSGSSYRSSGSSRSSGGSRGGSSGRRGGR